MFARVLRSHASKLGAAAAVASMTAASSSSSPFISPFSSYARCERVYASGEALGRGVRLELWKAKHENVVVLDLESELVQLGMTRIRDYENEGARFRHDANNVLRAALDLALTELPNDEEAVVTTPRGYKAEGLVLEDGVQVCGVSVASKPDVQIGLLQVLESTLPFESKFGAILVDEDAKGQFKVVKASLPDELEGHEVMLLVPEFAHVDQVRKIMHLLQQGGVEEDKITLVALVTCPEAADKFCEMFGDARLVTASFDAARDKDGKIVPGVGAFEGRYAGAPSSVVTPPPADAAGSARGDEHDGLRKTITKKITSFFTRG